jgi:hypothetical protein
VVVVDNLDEWANASTTSDLGLSLQDGLRGTVDTGDESVRIGTLLVSIVESLNDNGLLSGILAVEDDNNLTWLKAAEEEKRENKKSEVSQMHTACWRSQITSVQLKCISIIATVEGSASPAQSREKEPYGLASQNRTKERTT